MFYSSFFHHHLQFRDNKGIDQTCWPMLIFVSTFGDKVKMLSIFATASVAANVDDHGENGISYKIDWWGHYALIFP